MTSTSPTEVLNASEPLIPATPTAPTPEFPVVWTSAQWIAYFRANAANLLEVPWDSPKRATPAELAEIVDSLRAWQLGETSDGVRLTKAATRHAQKINDPDFVE